MSNISAKFNFVKKEWIIENHLSRSDNSTLEISVESDNEHTNIKNMQIGYRIESDSETISSGLFPPHGVRYELVSKYPIIIEPIDLEMDKSYKCSVYLIDQDKTYEKSMDFVGPKPSRPYPSWIWQHNAWVAPVPKPDGPHLWNEESRVWERAEPKFPYPS